LSSKAIDLLNFQAATRIYDTIRELIWCYGVSFIELIDKFLQFLLIIYVDHSKQAPIGAPGNELINKLLHVLLLLPHALPIHYEDSLDCLAAPMGDFPKGQLIDEVDLLALESRLVLELAENVDEARDEPFNCLRLQVDQISLLLELYKEFPDDDFSCEDISQVDQRVIAYNWWGKIGYIIGLADKFEFITSSCKSSNLGN
jgi:hypothetical protein